jgi:hypothetical protein
LLGHEDDAKTSRPPWPTVILLTIGGFLLLNVLAVGTVAVTPERCADCHLDGPPRLEVRSEHSDVPCSQCHVGASPLAAVDFAVRQVYGMYVELPIISGRQTASVSDETCVRCHELSGSMSADPALRIDHESCLSGRQCTDCHSRAAHGDSVDWARNYDMFDCLTCHMDRSISVECDVCHTERSPEERISTGTFSLLHRQNWRDMHGMGDPLTCAACHSAEKCQNFHGAGVPHEAAFSIRHSAYASDESAECESCHSQRFCDDCHGTQMPHPGTYASDHSGIVRRAGDALCLRCHDAADCSTCHTLHIHPGNAGQSERG